MPSKWTESLSLASFFSFQWRRSAKLACSDDQNMTGAVTGARCRVLDCLVDQTVEFAGVLAGDLVYDVGW